MRTPILRTPAFRTLVPGLLMSASVCLAADAPADPPADSPKAATETPAPAAVPEEPSPPPSPASGRGSEASSQPSPASEKGNESVQAEASDRQKMEEEALRKEGYKVTEVKGEKRYCKQETILGSRLNTRTVCWTADQIKANKEEADILREKQGQRQTF